MNNDLISREALKEDLAKEIKTNDMGLWLKILLVIDNAPTVERVINMYPKGEVIVQNTRPQGEWIVEDWTKIIECNLCHGQAPICITSGEQYESNFCPICGAKMKGGAV